MVVNAIRAFLRILAFLLVALITCFGLGFNALVRGGWKGQGRVMLAWRKTMAVALSMRVTQTGHIPEETCVVMSNHRSYADILLHFTGIPLVFVAKASVRKWPVVGWGGRMLGVIFVERSSTASRAQTRVDIQDRLNRGASVLIYPEGTTHKGPDILEYRPGVFKVAAEEDIPIVASAIEYENQDVAWVGDDTFLPHFLRIFGAGHLKVSIAFSEPFRGSDPDQLRKEVMDWTEAKCVAFRKAYDASKA